MATTENRVPASAAAEEFYVCAGICREDPETNRCMGCGRPWGLYVETPLAPAPDLHGVKEEQKPI